MISVLILSVITLSFLVGMISSEFIKYKNKFDSIETIDKETRKLLTQFEQIDEKLKSLINKQVSIVELEHKVESLNNRVVLLSMKK